LDFAKAGASNRPATSEHGAFPPARDLTHRRDGQAHKRAFTSQKEEPLREDEMAVDAVLWFILAGMIAFLGYGCFRTARH
jgi:hypothetical protein